MPTLFNRISRIIRSYFPSTGSEQTERYTDDPDRRQAWEELNDFLNNGPKKSSAFYTDKGKDNTRQEKPQAVIPESLKQDYRNMKCTPDASYEQIRAAYRMLLKQYHPDQYANDPVYFHKATEITKKINASFLRIKKYLQTGEILS